MSIHVSTVGPAIRANSLEPEVLRQMVYALSAGRSGIVSSGDYAVSQNGTPNMSVNVAAGLALVAGTDSPVVQGSYSVYNDGTVNLSIAASNASNPRVDLVELQVRDAYYSGSNNDARLLVKTGTAASSPTVPATDADCLVLAHVYVPANASSIVNANINGTTGSNNPDAAAAYSPPVVGTFPLYEVVGGSGSGFSAEVQDAALYIPDPGVPYQILIEAGIFISGTVASDLWILKIKEDVAVGGNILRQGVFLSNTSTVVRTFLNMPTGGGKVIVSTFGRNSGTGTGTLFADPTSNYLQCRLIRAR